MNERKLTILGIESSCDDTSCAILQDSKILANCVANQTIHESFGGVVPELASRAHQQNVIPVVNEALKLAKLKLSDVDAIGVTQGPGLMGSLLVGHSFAKSLSLGLNIPFINVHHMHAHILAHFIDDANEAKPSFPFLCLTVSGGHTQIVRVNSPTEMHIIGETIDDAAGEAFDKAAKLLGLPYPGGPLVDKHAKEGNPHAFKFSEPKVDGYNYSFSGLKTGILRFLQKELKANPAFITEHLNDICASVQHSIINILLKKLKKASKDLKINHIAIAGGVSANSGLRNALLLASAPSSDSRAGDETWNVYIPKFEYCTDNAAMIAMAAHYKYINQEHGSLRDKASARLEF